MVIKSPFESCMTFVTFHCENNAENRIGGLCILRSNRLLENLRVWTLFKRRKKKNLKKCLYQVVVTGKKSWIPRVRFLQVNETKR
jgi:hypothetical protein